MLLLITMSGGIGFPIDRVSIDRKAARKLSRGPIDSFTALPDNRNCLFRANRRGRFARELYARDALNVRPSFYFSSAGKSAGHCTATLTRIEDDPLPPGPLPVIVNVKLSGPGILVETGTSQHVLRWLKRSRWPQAH